MPTASRCLRASTYSQQSGWLVSTSVPEAIANRPIVHSWALVATLAVSFALLSALLAYLFGRKISDPVCALVEGARELGRGEAVAPINSSIREVRAVGEALAKASETRQLMERSLRDSEDRLRLGARLRRHRHLGLGLERRHAHLGSAHARAVGSRARRSRLLRYLRVGAQSARPRIDASPPSSVLRMRRCLSSTTSSNVSTACATASSGGWRQMGGRSSPTASPCA